MAEAALSVPCLELPKFFNPALTAQNEVAAAPVESDFELHGQLSKGLSRGVT